MLNLLAHKAEPKSFSFKCTDHHLIDQEYEPIHDTRDIKSMQVKLLEAQVVAQLKSFYFKELCIFTFTILSVYVW
jgi:hypothetical protein